MLMASHLLPARLCVQRLAPSIGLALLLGACANADRFTGQSIGSRPIGTAAEAQQPALPSAPPVATSRVESQELPPPGGVAASPQSGGLPPPADPFFQSSPPVVPTTPPPAPRSIETPTLQGGNREIATLGGGGTSGGTSTGRGPVSSRDGVVGGWTAREATGGSCRVTLSSTPALDLYRANASGCANRDLQKVTAWDYRDGEVYLYQPGGSVAARLRVSDGSSLGGVIARSGAGISMTR
jgi:hypothetical protein